MKTKHFFLICLYGFVFSICVQAQKELVILHTNDIHSHIEPLPDTDLYHPAKGGLVNRKAIIDSVRILHSDLILLDAGDFVQGTPYYNLFKGRVEVEGLNLLGYDAVTLGNHEFDYGLDTLQVILDGLNCPVICCNYDFTGTPLEGMVQPYLILKRKDVKIGIIGAGIDPQGLVQTDKYAGMVFLPVTETVNKYADFLKNKEKCDVIICLSHIGYNHDQLLAKESSFIDIIIGGHSHTFLQNGPDRITNLKGKDVLVYQVGNRGSYIGEIKMKVKRSKKR